MPAQQEVLAAIWLRLREVLGRAPEAAEAAPILVATLDPPMAAVQPRRVPLQLVALAEAVGTLVAVAVAAAGMAVVAVELTTIRVVLTLAAEEEGPPTQPRIWLPTSSTKLEFSRVAVQ